MRTGFIGFPMNIEALKIVYAEYIQTGKLESVFTFYLGQDLLESFFGRVRARHGRNDNPTASQFCAAYRALLVHNEISASEVANCKDSLNILSIPSTAKPPNSVIQTIMNTRTIDDSETDYMFELEYNDENDSPKRPNESLFQAEKLERGTIAYFAGQIEKKIESGRFECENGICSTVFASNEKIKYNFFNDNKFTQRPCESTVLICEIVHKLFTIHSKSIEFDYKKLLIAIKKEIPFSMLFPGTDFSHEIGHKVYFINYIIDEYVRLYGTYLARRVTLDQHELLLRRKLHKTIHFKNL